MKKLVVLFLFIYALTPAQNKRFLYQYIAVNDSTDKENVDKEFLVLDVSPAGSKFYSYEKYKSDSLMAIDVEKQSKAKTHLINIKSTYKGKVNYKISKEYPEFKTTFESRLGFNQYKVSDNRPINWQIKPEKKQIGEFNTQKAETDMYGRKWTAWFATDLPIQDGPYKFHGLPGLIVKIEDETKSYSFELKGVTNYVENEKSKLDDSFMFEKLIPVDDQQYKKLSMEEYSDPTKSLRQLFASAGPNFKVVGADGVEINPSEMIRKRELDAKENKKKNNNPLELDLLR